MFGVYALGFKRIWFESQREKSDLSNFDVTFFVGPYKSSYISLLQVLRTQKAVTDYFQTYLFSN